MRSSWHEDVTAEVGTFRVARDPNPASEAVKAAIAKASKRAEADTAAIKAKRRPSSTTSR